uniref:LAGLIDADG homing endonuclease n=1 Tax=Ditylenchus dipsaci TaxID=166011 RepID=A0A915DLU6_9BILA
MKLRKKLGQETFKRENPIAGDEISNDVRLLQYASCIKFSPTRMDKPLLDALTTKGWYEGLLNKVSQNNGLKSRKGLLKNMTFHKKLGLSDFISALEKFGEILIYPPDAISMNLQQKRKSGRPKLAGTALSMN